MIIKDRKINLVNIVLILYVFSIIVFNEGTTILKIIKVFFAGVCALNMLIKKKLYIDKYIVWMIVFVSFCILSINWSISKENAKDILSTLILNDICIFLIINLIYEDKKRLNTIINTVIFSSIVLALRIALVYGPFVFMDGSRAVQGLTSANTIGMIGAIAGVLSIYNIIANKNKYKVLNIIALVINLSMTILSGSRKALLFFLIPIIIYYILSSKNILNTLKKVIISVMICIVAFLGIMKVPFLYESVGNRVETMINGFLGEGEIDASTSLRLAMVEWGMEWFQEKPAFGYGINNYKTLLGMKGTSYGADGVYAHNNYIELLVDVGIVGTIIYYYIYIVILYRGIKNWKNLSKLQMIMLGIMVACIINEYGNVSYYAKFNQLILALSWMALSKEIIKKNMESDIK